jgi:hypothetical protein
LFVPNKFTKTKSPQIYRKLLDLIRIITMCTCKAYTYRSCRWGHAKFEAETVCFLARIGLREKCQERIINGHPDIPRHFPIVDGICDVCHPREAQAEEEAKKRAEKELKIKEAKEKKEKWLAERYSGSEDERGLCFPVVDSYWELLYLLSW